MCLNCEAISRSGWARDYENLQTFPVIARLDSRVLRQLLLNFQIQSYMIIIEFCHEHMFGRFNISINLGGEGTFLIRFCLTCRAVEELWAAPLCPQPQDWPLGLCGGHASSSLRLNYNFLVTSFGLQFTFGVLRLPKAQ